MRTIKAKGYVTIKPVWRGKYLSGIVMEKVTTKEPKTGTFGAVVVKLSVELPEHVFKPIEVDAEVVVQAEQLGRVVVTVEPFAAGVEQLPGQEMIAFDD